MRTKSIFYALVLLLAFALGCNKDQPMQNDQIDVSMSDEKWAQQVPYVDNNGRIRVPLRIEGYGILFINGVKHDFGKGKTIYLKKDFWSVVKSSASMTCLSSSSTIVNEELFDIGTNSGFSFGNLLNYCTASDQKYTQRVGMQLDERALGTFQIRGLYNSRITGCEYGGESDTNYSYFNSPPYAKLSWSYSPSVTSCYDYVDGVCGSEAVNSLHSCGVDNTSSTYLLEVRNIEYKLTKITPGCPPE